MSKSGHGQHAQVGRLRAAVLRSAFFVGLVASAGFASASASSKWTMGSTEITRRLSSRSLSQTSVIPSYLIPTMDEPICSGPSCCNSDYLASPYKLQHLNSTLMEVDGQQMTTFYMNLYSDVEQCSGYSGSNACCTANITKIWLDVDPMQEVQFLSFADTTINFLATQDQYGMQLVLPPSAGFSVPAGGVLITVTVPGNVSSLCAPPDYLLGITGGMPAICQVILQGSTPLVTDACCPYGLSEPINPDSPYVPQPPQCSQSIASSPLQLQLESVSLPFTSSAEPAGTQLANYTFAISAPAAACNSTAINQCCGITVDGVQITISSSAVVVSTLIDGLPASSVLFTPSGLGSGGFQTMTVSQLGLAPGSYPVTLTVTVQLPSGSSQVPDICQLGEPATAAVGACSYTLVPLAGSPGAGMCCPGSSTTAVTPSAPSGTCAPSIEVPLQATSMGFSYYEGPVANTASSTKFVFMVYNNASACPGKAYCQDICSWELFVNPAVAGLLSFEADMSSGSNGMQSINTGPNASVTFAAPPAAGTVSYTIIVAQAAVTLDQLCNGNALSDQNGSPCAAVISNPSVFSVVLFSESNVVMPPGGGGQPPAPSPGPSPPVSNICASGNPLSGSCVRVFNATYNSPSSTTVLDFNVVNYGAAAAGGCTPDEAVMAFQVLLQSSIAAQLQASNALVPSSAEFGSDNGVLDSVTWAWTPTEGASMHYQLDVSGSLTPASICLQNALPGQPAGTCVVAFTGATTCYTGYIPVVLDNNLQPIPVSTPTPSSSKVGASVIAPAVILPVLAVAALVAAALYYRRRRAQQQAAGGGLQAPLASPAGSSAGADVARESANLFERAASDVLVRLPSGH